MEWFKRLFSKTAVTTNVTDNQLLLKKFAHDFMLSEEDIKEIDNSAAFKSQLYLFLQRYMVPSYVDDRRIKAGGAADAVDVWYCRYRQIVNDWRDLRLRRYGAVELGLAELSAELLDKLINYDPEKSIQAEDRKHRAIERSSWVN